MEIGELGLSWEVLGLKPKKALKITGFTGGLSVEYQKEKKDKVDSMA